MHDRATILVAELQPDKRGEHEFLTIGITTNAIYQL